MPAYLVTLDRTKSGHTLPNGVDAQVVFAADATTAKQIAAAKYDGDGAAWTTDGTATEITAASDWAGWKFDVTILSGFGTGGTSPATASVTADATTNTMDEIGAALATALNALPLIANAAYNTTSNTLTIAGTADALGDKQVEVYITPPLGKSSVAALVGTIVDGGASGDALSVILPADAAVVPVSRAAVTQA